MLRNKKSGKSGNNDKNQTRSWFGGVTIVGCIFIALMIFLFVMGDPSNFENNDPNAQPLPGAYLGMAYKGGYVVPILLGMLLMVFTFAIERAIVLKKSSGTGNLNLFIRKIQSRLNTKDLDSAIVDCDRQKGSVANVIKSTLNKYKNLKDDHSLNWEQKEAGLKKEIEEATVLEMPMLQHNMNMLASLVSLGTLVGLLGTVIGMIRAFNALATSGAPDQTELANGISEALFNTATGIATSVAAIIAYATFSQKIDKLTFFIDEAGFSIVQTFNTEKK